MTRQEMKVFHYGVLTINKKERTIKFVDYNKQWVKFDNILLPYINFIDLRKMAAEWLLARYERR